MSTGFADATTAKIAYDTVTCSVEYQDYTKVVPKEPGKGVSAVTDTKPVANRYTRGSESIIALLWNKLFQVTVICCGL
jgi:hypothetical protein